MKAKASINISDSETLVESLVIARDRIQVMIDKGMDNANAVLQGLVDHANAHRRDRAVSARRWLPTPARSTTPSSPSTSIRSTNR